MSVYPPRRKATTPRVNRAVAVLRVEEAACADEGYGGTHALINYGDDGVRCMYCDRTWAELDGVLNRRPGWLE